MYYGNLRILQDSWPQNNVVGSFFKALGGGTRQKIPFWFNFFRLRQNRPRLLYIVLYIIRFDVRYWAFVLGPIRRAEEAYRVSQNKRALSGWGRSLNARASRHGNISLRLVGLKVVYAC